MAQIIHTTEFITDATEWIAAKARTVQCNGGTFRFSLCGGSTPKAIYASLAGRNDIDWSRVLITFGDERAVPPDHEDSNYRMAKISLLDPAGIPETNVLRMEGELDAAEAAQRYEDALRRRAAETGDEIFRHDLVLLGMGDDGHTASLFPDTAALTVTDRWVTENYVPKLDSFRITMTYPLINAACEVCFLITGDSKKPIFARVRGGSDDPAAKVDPVSGHLTWMVGWAEGA